MWQYNYTDYDNDFLAHHGIKGQQWGIRRFQNPDGSLTPEGRDRYGVGNASDLPKGVRKGMQKMDKKLAKLQKRVGRGSELLEETYGDAEEANEVARWRASQKQKMYGALGAIGLGVGAVGTALLAAGVPYAAIPGFVGLVTAGASAAASIGQEGVYARKYKDINAYLNRYEEEAKILLRSKEKIDPKVEYLDNGPKKQWQ